MQQNTFDDIYMWYLFFQATKSNEFKLEMNELPHSPKHTDYMACSTMDITVE